MTRTDLIAAIASRFPSLTVKDADIAVKEILDAIGRSLAQGDRLEIRGFGSFRLNYHPARTGRNPRTAVAVPVPAKYVPHFTAGKEQPCPPWYEPERGAYFHRGMSLKEEVGERRNGLIIRKMVIDMNETQLCTIEQVEQFLNASAVIEFSAAGDDSERYAHISRVLKRFDYPGRGKRERGVLRRYLRHTSGYSRAQITRLVARWQGNRLAPVPLIKRYGAPAKPFARKYTAADITLLVEMDKAHEDVCGPAIVHLLRRAFREYGDSRYERLATLPASHLYNLRKSAGYQAQRIHFAQTRPVCNTIGIRKAPAPDGRAGFVRIDTVHQGDLDGVKGVYHITCVDAVSQWQVEACVQGISEAFLLPVLALILAQFPFVVRGFHSDNGSEFINHRVAQLLEKLRIEQTKSRSRHSNDNALAESKNASVVRKHMGYSHIPQHFARRINVFYQETFNPWLNLHRPCLFATAVVSPKGKVVKRYRHQDVKTPLERLAQLCEQDLAQLSPDTTLQALQTQARAQTDLAATQAMQRGKSDLFASFEKPKRRA